MARGILDGTIDPNSISKRGGLQGEVFARVKQLDPKFNIVQAGGNAKFATANQTQQTTALLNGIDPIFEQTLASVGKS